MPDYTLEEICDAINKAWILGEDRFKKRIEEQTGRRVSPKSRGGDRRSEKYRESLKLINNFDPIDWTALIALIDLPEG
jgi:hypothetical protein